MNTDHELSLSAIFINLIVLIFLPPFLTVIVGYDAVLIPFFVLGIFLLISLYYLIRSLPEGHYSKRHLVVGQQYRVVKKAFYENQSGKQYHAIISDGKSGLYHLVVSDNLPEEGKWFFLNNKRKIVEWLEN